MFEPGLVVANGEDFELVRVPVLVPDVFEIVLLLRAVFPVHKGALLANEDAVVEHAERRLVFHTVNTELVELIFYNLSVEVVNQVGMLYLGQVLGHTWDFSR